MLQQGRAQTGAGADPWPIITNYFNQCFVTSNCVTTSIDCSAADPTHISDWGLSVRAVLMDDRVSACSAAKGPINVHL